MQAVPLIDRTLFGLILNRLCYQLIENHNDFSDTVLIGLQPRGVFLSDRLAEDLRRIQPDCKLQYGILDTTFYRDDFRRQDKQLIAHKTDIPFSLENKRVILVDDVLYTGRTIRAGLEGLLEHGRPTSVELLVLIDRRFTRELPIEPKYVGRSVDSYDNQIVKVLWRREGNKNDEVLLLND